MQDRLDWFTTELSKHFKNNLIVVTAKDVAGAKDALNMSYDLAFLDHDLGGRVFVPSEDPETGYAVAKYIRDNNISINKIVIHSLNYDGARHMQAVLPGSYRIPYLNLVQNLGWFLERLT